MKINYLIIVLFTQILLGCTGIPNDLKAVNNFALNRYLGGWYEIARLDHRFERGLNNISANYSMNNDGSVKVINKGWNVANQKWEQVEGKAYFVEQPDIGRLKVSFFGPFYGGYNIIDLDKKITPMLW
jgi:apolipoprotein D and lipocalin family protein